MTERRIPLLVRLFAMVSMVGGLLVAAAPGQAGAAGYIFCGTTSGRFVTTTAGRSGTAIVTGTCATPATWRLDLYVNAEWWNYRTGSVGTGSHSISVSAPWMPKPNDSRGNYVWVKVTYKYGSWTNIYEQEIGWVKCSGCTG